MKDLTVVLEKQLQVQEEVSCLETMLKTAGTTWIGMVLKDLEIPGRTTIVDSFRENYAGYWPSPPRAKKTGRTDQDRENSCKKLLNEKPLSFWISLFLEHFPLAVLPDPYRPTKAILTLSEG